MVELASRIKSVRLAKGYTLNRVAEISGLAKGLLSKVENFLVTSSLPSLPYELADAVGGEFEFQGGLFAGEHIGDAIEAKAEFRDLCADGVIFQMHHDEVKCRDPRSGSFVTKD